MSTTAPSSFLEHDSSSPPQCIDPVIIDYEDLKGTPSLAREIIEAFGFDGVGLIAVRGVPGYDQLRREALASIRKVGTLPQNVLKKYESPTSSYAVGWSHGKEKFGNKIDFGKGSFYANPLYDNPAEASGDPSAELEFPTCASKNVWPEEVPEFEVKFKEMGRMLADVARLLLKKVDSICRTQLESITFDRSTVAVGRALHYFPSSQEEGSEWCGWHNDNSTVTGLLCAQFYDDKEGIPIPNPDPAAGLYVQARDGNIYKVSFPPSCLAFQLGEAAQILSGGSLVATPHMVTGTKVGGVSREQLAVFFEPSWKEPLLPPPSSFSKNSEKLMISSSKVPPLEKRFEEGMSFGKFLEKSYQEYYKHALAVQEQES